MNFYFFTLLGKEDPPSSSFSYISNKYISLYL
jgi:hypothetical protein